MRSFKCSFLCNYVLCVHCVFELLGKIWNNVWGNLSDDYSRRIIRNYLCQTEINIKTRRNLQQLTIRSIAAMHRGGVNIRQEVQFGRMVQNRYRSSKFIFIS